MKMKTLLALIVISLLGLVSVKSQIVLQNLTDSEYGTIVSTSTTSWKFTAEAGFTSTSTNELGLESNITEQLNHAWSRPDPITGIYDLSGNLNFQVGSTTMLPQQPVAGFNAMLLRLSDASPFSITTLTAGSLNTVPFRDLLADSNNGPFTIYDQILITGFGDTFNLQANFTKGEFAIGNESVLTIMGIYNSNFPVGPGAPGIPEPSSFLMMSLSALLLLSVRRRVQTASMC